MYSQMRRSLYLFLVVTLVGGLSSCLHLLRGPDKHFNFSHELHAKDNEIACLDCHGDVATSTDAETRHLPDVEVCGQCHEPEVAGTACGTCHQDASTLETAKREEPIQRVVRHEIPLNFSHANHLPRVDSDCLVCHERVLKATRPTQPKLPDMDACMTCHQDDYDELNCSKCHTDLSDPRYRPQLARFAHKGDWLRNHQLHSEQQDPTACAQCHMESFCADCHSGVDNKVKASTKWPRREDRQFIHRGDYVSRHRIDAQRDAQQCFGCHRLNTCTDCHGRSGVRWVAGGPNPWEGGNHPIVNVSNGVHDTSAASLAAIRRNIVQCAACHEGEAPVCTTCHAAINPHPPGFTSTFNKNVQPVCRKCHNR